MSLDFFFNPKGVAIIGATDSPQKGGYHILNNTLGGYKGKVYPVNPKYSTLLGQICYPDIASIPDDFDLVIFFIPAAFLPSVIEECAKKNVKGIIIESAGFAEVGNKGKALQETCVSLAKKHNIRLWGPNCMGLLDGHLRHVFSFMYDDSWKTLMAPGNVSMIVQSGMLSAGFLLMILERGGLGISKMCSIGNKCDIHETELLEYLIHDPNTAVIGLYVESIVDARRFIELASATSKPIILLKGGRSPQGAGAAMSHTASMSGDYVIMRHAFKQAGIIEVSDVHELMDFLRGFSKTYACRNDGGTAVVTFSGGGGVLTADLLYENNISLAQFSDKTLHSMKEVYPPWMEPSNPADIWPAIEHSGFDHTYSSVIDAVMHDNNVDSLILHTFTNRVNSEALLPLSKMKNELGKPVIAWLTGKGQMFHTFRKALEDMGIPVYEEMKRGVSVLAAIKTHFRKHGTGKTKQME